MKTLVFSDTHLQLRFDEKKYNFLSSIIKDADKVIINGDFWDGYLISFDQFITSPWKQLFPLLKAKKAIYLYGNHDDESFVNEDVHLFSDVQTKRHEMPFQDKTLIIEHGDRILPLAGTKFDARTATTRAARMYYHTDKLLVKLFGRLYLQKVMGHQNRIMKRRLKKELKANEVYVCGHTHCAEINWENQFLNSGMIMHGIGQYILIENDTLSFKDVNYS